MQTAITTKPAKTQPFTPVRSLLQRKCDCGKSSGLSGQCSNCEAKKLLQRKSNYSAEVTEVPPIVHEVLNSPGQGLELGTRISMESRFGQDFSQIRVHTNDQAQRSARAVNALAYTVGSNIVFGARQYSPRTRTGQKVLAHELTHTLQQRSMSNPAIAALKVGSANDSYEREAEAQAEKVVSTNEAISPPTQHTFSTVQRLGDITKVPPGLSCPIAASSAPSETDHISFPNSGVTLSPFQQSQIENFVVNWRASGASAPVRVDGFASQVGADELNWRLSCDRAQVVVAELRHPSSGRVVGIPASFITVFAQGETTEFGSDSQNRRVTIHTPLPTPPTPPTPPHPTFNVCARDLQGVLGYIGNHAYIDAPPFRYAIISPLCGTGTDNPVTGTTAQKWDNSPDPCGKTPHCVPCTPLPGVTDLAACFRAAFAAYNNPSLYRGTGPNSNTFAGTLARTCCAGMVPKPPILGNVPGWHDRPAPARAGATPCPPGPTC